MSWTVLTWNGASTGAPITAASFHLLACPAHGFFTVNVNSLDFTETIAGDASEDGRVDLTDLALVLNNFGKTTSLWTDGNFDGTPTIDLTDLSDVLNNFGITIPAPATAPATPAISIAPEPASLFALAVMPLAALRRKQK